MTVVSTVVPTADSRIADSRTAAAGPHGGPAGGGDGPVAVPAALLVRVHLSKQEVFEACQALADADRVLVAAGCVDQARALGDLFELLEDRLSGPRPTAP